MGLRQLTVLLTLFIHGLIFGQFSDWFCKCFLIYLQFLCCQNIKLFLDTCKSYFGIRDGDLFEPMMLYNLTNFHRVLITLSKLSRRVAQIHSNISYVAIFGLLLIRWLLYVYGCVIGGCGSIYWFNRFRVNFPGDFQRAHRNRNEVTRTRTSIRICTRRKSNFIHFSYLLFN